MDYLIKLTDSEFNCEIVQRLKKERNSRGLTQLQLADSVGLSEQQIKELETERSTVDIPKLRRICEFYHLQMLSMMPDTEVTRKDEVDLGNISDYYKKLSAESKKHIDLLIMHFAELEANK